MDKCKYCHKDFDWEQAESEYNIAFPDGDYYGDGYAGCCEECAIKFQYDSLESEDDDTISEGYAADIYMSSGEDEDYTFGYDAEDLRQHYT